MFQGPRCGEVLKAAETASTMLAEKQPLQLPTGKLPETSVSTLSLV